LSVVLSILSYIAAFLLIVVLIIAHESGHFFVGKACDIHILEFGIGFGPKLFSRKKKDIVYSVRALPLGGFVQFAGEDEASDDPRAFNNVSLWKRFVTLLAGPGMNIVFAFVVSVITLVCIGDSLGRSVIVDVDPNLPAYEAGIESGDKILEVDGRPIDFAYYELANKINASKDDGAVELTLERGGNEITVNVPFANVEGQQMMGITYSYEHRSYGFFEAIGLSFKWLYLVVAEMFRTIGNFLFRGQGAENFGGIVATVTLMGQAVRYDFEVLMQILAMISLNLAVFNLLPFPGLDGGRIVLVGIEKLRGKPLPRDKEAYINFAGLAVLMILMILLTYQDIARLVTGG